MLVLLFLLLTGTSSAADRLTGKVVMLAEGFKGCHQILIEFSSRYYVIEIPTPVQVRIGDGRLEVPEGSYWFKEYLKYVKPGAKVMVVFSKNIDLQEYAYDSKDDIYIKDYGDEKWIRHKTEKTKSVFSDYVRGVRVY